jgi:hypothetical protein
MSEIWADSAGIFSRTLTENKPNVKRRIVILKNIFRKLRTLINENVHTLLSLRASPHQIALGLAIGVFIGIFPTFGLGGVFIIALATFWKFNIPGALVGTLIGNPLFAPLWITLSCLITGISPSEIKVPKEPFHEILKHYSGIGLRYLVGNGLVSLFVAILSYFIVTRAIQWYRARKDKQVFISKQGKT